MALQALYAKYVARLNLPQSRRWMGQLFLVLQAWYDDYKPAKRRKFAAKSAAELPSTTCVIYVNDLAPMTFDDFVDPFEAGPAAAAAAGGAALAAAAAAGTAAAAPPGSCTRSRGSRALTIKRRTP